MYVDLHKKINKIMIMKFMDANIFKQIILFINRLNMVIFIILNTLLDIIKHDIMFHYLHLFIIVIN